MDDETPAPESAASHPSPDPVPPEPAPACLLIPGTRLSTFELLLTVGLIVTAVVMPATMGARSFVLVPLVVVALVMANRTIMQWLCPPKFEISAAGFRWRQNGATRQTPLSNVADIFMLSAQVMLRFHDVLLVVPPKNRAALERFQRKFGVHVIYPPGTFRLSQVNQLREAVGLAPQVADPRGAALADFQNALRRATPRVWVTPLIVGVNVAVLAVMFALLLSNPAAHGTAEAGSLPAEMLLQWGANYGPLSATTEPWRLLTSVFLHGSLMHLGLNMWVLWSVGRAVERLLGNGPFLVAYLFAGACGSLASLAWDPSLVSVGASGAVFGMFGILLGFAIRRRQEIATEILQQLKSVSIKFLVFNLVYAAMIPGIDMAAHVGGLLGGVACGLALKPLSVPTGIGRWRLIPQLLAAGLLVTGGYWLLPRPAADIRREFMTIFQLQDQLERQFQAEVQKHARTTPKELMRIVQRKVIVPWEAARSRFAVLEHVTSRDESTREALLAFMRLRTESWILLAEAQSENNLAKQGQALEKMESARNVIQVWLRAEATRFGMKPELPPWPTTLEDEVALIAAVEARVTERFNKLTQDDKQKKLPDEEFANRLEREVLMPWRTGLKRLMRAAFGSNGQRPSPDVVRRIRFMDFRAKSWQLQIEATREQDPAKAKESAELHQAAEQLLKGEDPQRD